MTGTGQEAETCGHSQVQEQSPVTAVDQMPESGGIDVGMQAHLKPKKGLPVSLSWHHWVPTVFFQDWLLSGQSYIAAV